MISKPANLQIQMPYDDLAAFCRRNHVQRLRVFGSVLRDDFSASSDVDLLVDFEQEAQVGLFDLVRMQRELQTMIGREVDLLTSASLSSHFRHTVQDEAQILYVRIAASR